MALGGAQRLARMVGHVAMVQATEVALLASFVTTAPVRRFTDTDALHHPAAAADGHDGKPVRPVLLVHGYCGTKSSWSVVTRTLLDRGFAVAAVAYSPFGTSVERLAGRIVAEVDRVRAETGADKVDLVGHSLGGVVIAEALSTGRLDGKVDTVVTLGSPFGGSPWATLLPVGEVARALRGGSPLLCRLNATPTPHSVRWLAFSAAQDIVVPGPRSVPTHALVETVKVAGVGHLGMLLNREVVERIANTLVMPRTVRAQVAA